MSMRKTMILLHEICLEYHKPLDKSFTRLQTLEYNIHTKNINNNTFQTTYFYTALGYLIKEYKQEKQDKSYIIM